MAISKKESKNKAYLYTEETGKIKFDWGCGMFPKFVDKKLKWYMPKVVMFLDRGELSKIR